VHQIEAKHLKKEKKMKDVLKEKKEYFNYKNKKTGEKYELIKLKKKAIAIDNAARLEKLKL